MRARTRAQVDPQYTHYIINLIFTKYIEFCDPVEGRLILALTNYIITSLPFDGGKTKTKTKHRLRRTT
jgi:hypothetical protein